MGMTGCVCCWFHPLSFCWSHCVSSLFCYLPVVDSQTLLLNGFGIFFVTCSIHLWVYWSMLAALDYLSHITVLFVDITCVWWHLESIPLKHFIFWMLCLTTMCSILGVLILHFEILCLFLSYVVCFMLSVLNVRMLSSYAYHGHGRLFHWQLFLNLYLSMPYCTFTILLHLLYCVL